ncbi:probable transcriptional regulatory protein TTE1135 [Eurosta solidaginis]|uniref:probable transcriptional regulatory protein TTE1135 n=1 Tax=Eurosta solidaginis TaxID=178769 RepID=UPI00353115BD
MHSFRTVSKDANKSTGTPSTSSRYSPQSPVQVTPITSNVSTFRHAVQRVAQAPLQDRLAHKLRLAVYEGDSSDPRKNRKLKMAIRRVSEQGLTMDKIESIINRYAETRDSPYCQIIQIRYNRKIFIICTLRTGSSMELKARLMALMRRNNANFVHVLHNFYSIANIEAIISYQTSLNFCDLECSIARDGAACKAKTIEMIDYETGAVNFKCKPNEMDEVPKAVIAKGYRVLHTELCFRPKQLIKLNDRELEDYRKFRARLEKLHNFDMIVDNIEEEVQKSIVPIEEIGEKE